MPSATLPAGTPLWKKPTVKGETSAHLNSDTLPLHPESTTSECTVFCGVTILQGELITSSSIAIRNTGRSLCRVKGPVEVLEAVGFVEGFNYLAKAGSPSAGLCLQSVPDGQIKLVEVELALGVSAASVEVKRLRVKAEGADFLICLDSDDTQIVVQKPGVLGLYGKHLVQNQWSALSSTVNEIGPGIKSFALNTGFVGSFEPFQRVYISSGNNGWMEGAVKSFTEVASQIIAEVEIGGLFEGSGSFSEWGVSFTAPLWSGIFDSNWIGTIGLGERVPFIGGGNPSHRLTQSSLDDSTLDGYLAGWFEEGFLWRRGVALFPAHDFGFIPMSPLEPRVFSNLAFPTSQKLCVYPSYLHTGSVNYTAGIPPQDGVLASATCKFGIAEQGVAFADNSNSYPLKEIFAVKGLTGAYYRPPSLAMQPTQDFSGLAIWTDWLDLNIDGREWKTLAEVKFSQQIAGWDGSPVALGILGNE